jgi:hypothetical protein
VDSADARGVPGLRLLLGGGVQYRLRELLHIARGSHRIRVPARHGSPGGGSHDAVCLGFLGVATGIERVPPCTGRMMVTVVPVP